MFKDSSNQNYILPSDRTSSIWMYFINLDYGETARCKICKEKLRHNKSIACLWNYFKTKHSEEHNSLLAN